MPHHDDLTATLSALLDTAIDECIRAKNATDFTFPFLLMTGPQEKSLTVLVSDADNPGQRALADARETVRAKAVELDAYVIAYDGMLKAKDGRNLLAFILECGEKPQAEGFVFFQRYDLDEAGKLVLVFGAGSFLRRTEQLLA